MIIINSVKHSKTSCLSIEGYEVQAYSPEEVGHNFRGMCISLSRIICNVLFLLTQRVDLGCVGVHCNLWQMRSN